MNDLDKNDLVNLIVKNENLIYSLANRFSSYSSKEDLYQIGIIGLINAYRNFNPNRGCKFSTYAFPYILGEMKKYVREDIGIKISRDTIYLCSRIERARELLMQNLKRYPTITELSSYLEVEETKIIEALQINFYLKSLDEPINNEDKELTLKDCLSQEDTTDKLDLISLKEELKNLSTEEKMLLKFRYLEDKTQQEIADIMGMSQVQVSRGEQRVLSKLRQRMFH